MGIALEDIPDYLRSLSQDPSPPIDPLGEPAQPGPAPQGAFEDDPQADAAAPRRRRTYTLEEVGRALSLAKSHPEVKGVNWFEVVKEGGLDAAGETGETPGIQPSAPDSKPATLPRPIYPGGRQKPQRIVPEEPYGGETPIYSGLLKKDPTKDALSLWYHIPDWEKKIISPKFYALGEKRGGEWKVDDFYDIPDASKARLSPQALVDDKTAGTDARLTAALDIAQAKWDREDWAIKDYAPYWFQRTPGVSSIYTAVQAKHLIDDLKGTSRVGSEGLHYTRLAETIIAASEAEKQGMGKKALDILTAMPGIMVEFGLTSGAATASRLAAKSALKLATKKFINRKVKKLIGKAGTRVALRSARLAREVVPRAGAVVGRGAALPHWSVANYMDRMVPEFKLTRDQAGWVSLKVGDNKDDFMDHLLAMGGGVADTFIDVAAEQSGGIISKALRTDILKAHILAKWVKMNPNASPSSLSRMLKKGGWSTPIAEVMEERAAEVAKITTGGETGAVGSLLEGEHKEFWEQIGSEAMAFMAIPGAQSGGYLINSRKFKIWKEEAKLTEGEAAAFGEGLSQEAADMWASTRPELAKSIAGSETVSREQWKGAGLGGISSNKEERAHFASLLENSLDRGAREAAGQTPPVEVDEHGDPRAVDGQDPPVEDERDPVDKYLDDVANLGGVSREEHRETVVEWAKDAIGTGKLEINGVDNQLLWNAISATVQEEGHTVGEPKVNKGRDGLEADIRRPEVEEAPEEQGEADVEISQRTEEEVPAEEQGEADVEISQRTEEEVPAPTTTETATPAEKAAQKTERGAGDIRSVAELLARQRNRKTKSVFSASVTRKAKEIGVDEGVLWEAIRDAGLRQSERRKTDRGAEERRAARNDKESAELSERLKELSDAGWVRTYVSESGSQYFEREGETLRISDHLVPSAPVRDLAAEDRYDAPQWDHEIIVGSRGWNSGLKKIAKPAAEAQAEAEDADTSDEGTQDAPVEEAPAPGTVPEDVNPNDARTWTEEEEKDRTDKALDYLSPNQGEKATEVKPTTEEGRGAQEFAKSLGVKMIFVDDQYLPEEAGASFAIVRAGMQEGEAAGVVAVRSSLEGEALLRVAVHEIAHGTGVDRIDVGLTGQEKQELTNEYLSRGTEKQQEVLRKRLESNPELASREAVAVLAERLLRDTTFRNKMVNEKPTIFRKIVDAIRRFFETYPKAKLTESEEAILNKFDQIINSMHEDHAEAETEAQSVASEQAAEAEGEAEGRQGIPEAGTTSGVNVETAEDIGRIYGLTLDGLLSPTRRSWESLVEKAIGSGDRGEMVRKAKGLAAPINLRMKTGQKVGALSDADTASLIVGMATLKNDYIKILKEIDGLAEEIKREGDEEKRQGLVSEREDLVTRGQLIENDHIDLYTANKTSGTEQGRALASRKIRLDETFSFADVVSQARFQKGYRPVSGNKNDITSKQRSALEKLYKENKDLVEELQQVELTLAKEICKTALGTAKEKGYEPSDTMENLKEQLFRLLTECEI